MIFRLNSRGRIVAILATGNDQDLSLLRGFDFVSLVEDEDRAQALGLLSAKGDREEALSAVVRLKLSMSGSARYRVTAFRDRDLFLVVDPIDVTSGSPEVERGEAVHKLLWAVEPAKDIVDADSEYLDDTKKKTRLLFDKLPLALFVVSKNGMIEGANGVACEMFGYDAKQLALVSITSLLTQSSAEFELTEFLRRMIGRTFRVVGTRRDDANFPAEVHTQFLDDSGDLLLLSVFDISEQEALERFRSEFQRVLRHDIRGPLTSVVLFLDTVKKGLYRSKPSERLEERALLMSSEASKLVARISGLLEMENLNADPATYEWAQVAVSELVRDCLAEVSAVDGDAALAGDAVQDRQVFTDPVRLKRALCDLLKLMAENSAEKISLSVTDEPHRVTIWIAGNLLLKQTRERIMLKLSMTEAVIEACGGEFDFIESENGTSKIVIAFRTD
ncbi:MAG: PAS domain-containing protein [Candidatus Melainabacteria bacterium]|nr:PAS domain-containing protein [Candidatus Melainabacteria bacterium]